MPRNGYNGVKAFREYRKNIGQRVMPLVGRFDLESKKETQRWLLLFLTIES
jgi:hypothetical protein